MKDGVNDTYNKHISNIAKAITELRVAIIMIMLKVLQRIFEIKGNTKSMINHIKYRSNIDGSFWLIFKNHHPNTINFPSLWSLEDGLAKPNMFL